MRFGTRDPHAARPSVGQWGLGPGARVSIDVAAVLAALFVTFTLQFFASTAWIPALLRLSPLVWREGYLWQVITYAFAGFGPPSPWFLLELLVLYWFAAPVLAFLGRRRFWTVLIVATVLAALAACVTAWGTGALAFAPEGPPFGLMQGQRMLIAVTVAAFSVLQGEATILLFFVLPIKARWFLWIEMLLAFVAFLSTKDLAGFVGICAGCGVAVMFLRRRAARSRLRSWWLEFRRRRLERKLDRVRRKKGFRVIDGGGKDKGPTIN